jgi:hypothetical protein
VRRLCAADADARSLLAPLKRSMVPIANAPVTPITARRSGPHCDCPRRPTWAIFLARFRVPIDLTVLVACGLMSILLCSLLAAAEG